MLLLRGSGSWGGVQSPVGAAFSLRPPLSPHPLLKGPDSETWAHRWLPQHRAEETTPKPPPSHPLPLSLASRKEPWGQPWMQDCPCISLIKGNPGKEPEPRLA